MGEISRSVLVNGVRVKALLDSGATDNHLSQRVADRVHLFNSGRKISFETANGQKLRGWIGNVGIRLNNRFGSTEVVVSNVLPRDGYDLILGQNFLQDNEVKLDFKKDVMEYGSHQPKIRRVGRL
jgi:predicted aspartyl protease